MQVLKTTYYKIAVSLVSIIVTAFTLSRYALLIQHLLKIQYNWLFELCMVIGMLFFQFPFIYKKSSAVKLDYYFNLLLVSLMGAFLLWPLLILNRFYACNDMTNIIYFFAVVLLMFFEHKRRVAALSLPVFISYTWVLYRLIILIFIL
jgi:Ca2+/Na+ antiporter